MLMTAKKKRIVFVQHSSAIGGASWCLVAILQALDTNLIDPHIVLFNSGPLFDRIKALGFPVTILSDLDYFPVYEHRGSVFGLITLFSKAFTYCKCYRQMYNYCIEVNPDIIYLNSLGLLALALPAKRAGVQSVYLQNREHWEPSNIMKIKNPLKNYFVKNHVDKIFHITKAGFTQFGDFSKSVLIRDWPTFEETTQRNIREELGIPPSTFIILASGGAQSIKGSKDLLLALPFMKYNNQVAVIILGCIPVKLSKLRTIAKHLLNRGVYRNSLARIASKDKRIFLLPSTNNMKAFIEASNVIVSPFTLSHAAKAALEAQSLGRPAILYDNPEAQEYIMNEITGIIVPSGDIKELAKALDRLAHDKALCESMGNKGKEYIGNHFSATTSIKLLTSAFLQNRDT